MHGRRFLPLTCSVVMLQAGPIYYEVEFDQ